MDLIPLTCSPHCSRILAAGSSAPGGSSPHLCACPLGGDIAGSYGDSGFNFPGHPAQFSTVTAPLYLPPPSGAWGSRFRALASTPISWGLFVVVFITVLRGVKPDPFICRYSIFFLLCSLEIGPEIPMCFCGTHLLKIHIPLREDDGM